MIPQFNITLYGNPKDKNEHYFETAKVLKVGEEFVLGDKRPMRIDDLAVFNKAFVKSKVVSRYVSAPFYNVIYCNFSELDTYGVSKETLQMVWFSPSTKRMLHFSKGNSIKSGKYTVPATIWKYEKGTLSIFCVENKLPHDQIKLYYTPFMNMYVNGTVCVGTSDLSLKGIRTIEEAKNKIEEGFFRSEFTHFHHIGFKKHAHEIYELMKNNVDVIKELEPMKDQPRTLKELCLTL